MENLNKSWMALIAIGIFFLLFFLAYNIFESMNDDTEFNPTVNELERGNLISNQLEEHLTTQ